MDLVYILHILLFQFQLGILATDGGTPPKSTTATVEITVVRNLNAPEFNPSRYEIEILENQLLGENIATIVASDVDRIAPHNQLTYRITEDSGPSLNFFIINGASGDVALKRSLLGETNERYEVSGGSKVALQKSLLAETDK